MGIRVTVPSVKGSNSIFHKLSYYGPVWADIRDDKLLYIYLDLPECRKPLAVINDWIYYELIENCEENRKTYKKENENEVAQ